MERFAHHIVSSWPLICCYWLALHVLLKAKSGCASVVFILNYLFKQAQSAVVASFALRRCHCFLLNQLLGDLTGQGSWLLGKEHALCRCSLIYRHHGVEACDYIPVIFFRIWLLFILFHLNYSVIIPISNGWNYFCKLYAFLSSAFNF